MIEIDPYLLKELEYEVAGFPSTYCSNAVYKMDSKDILVEVQDFTQIGRDQYWCKIRTNPNHISYILWEWRSPASSRPTLIYNDKVYLITLRSNNEVWINIDLTLYHGM